MYIGAAFVQLGPALVLTPCPQPLTWPPPHVTDSRRRRHLLGDCFPCSKNCAVCSEQRTLRNAQGNPTGFKEITIDASSCKNGDLSWMCCRGASDGAANLACTLTPGGCSADGTPVYDFGKNKCDSKVQMGTCEWRTFPVVGVRRRHVWDGA